LGGSRGSLKLNRLIHAKLNRLLENYQLIHQTGYLDYPFFKEIVKTLPDDLKERYLVLPVIDPDEIHKFYQISDIIISRAGANTVAEIMIVKRPAVLIPLPFLYNNEQLRNAQLAQKFGIARVVEEKDATPERIYSEVKYLVSNWKEIVKMVSKKNTPDLLAAKRIVTFLENLIKDNEEEKKK